MSVTPEEMRALADIELAISRRTLPPLGEPMLDIVLAGVASGLLKQLHTILDKGPKL